MVGSPTAVAIFYPIENCCIAPITAKVEVIGKPRESSYEAGKFYYPTLFIDLSQPEGAEAAKIWKNLSGDEVSQLQKGDRVQLVPTGKDKSGKDKHNIMLLEEQNPVTTSDCDRSEVEPVAERWSAERKREIAYFGSYIWRILLWLVLN